MDAAALAFRRDEERRRLVMDQDFSDVVRVLVVIKKLSLIFVCSFACSVSSSIDFVLPGTN